PAALPSMCSRPLTLQSLLLFLLITPPPPTSTLFPYTTLFRSLVLVLQEIVAEPVVETLAAVGALAHGLPERERLEKAVRKGANGDRKSTRLNSSHVAISYAVFCLKKKKKS